MVSLPLLDPEAGLSRPKTYFQRLQRQYSFIPRILKIFIISTIALVVGRDLWIRIQGDFDYKLKILPTDFEALARNAPKALWQPQHPIQQLNGSHIGDRYIFMRHLGTGNEGSASLYIDVPTGKAVVVKTWLGACKNIRNLIPNHLLPVFAGATSKWPAEIEAGLLLGDRSNDKYKSFVPVEDYFILQSGADGWHWAMVSPFIEGGDLDTLAESTKVHERTPQKLDVIFRPVFNSLLDKLGNLHEMGYCHDDIKPDNVFIANTTQWLLGDLGNVRHVTHPWHATQRWKRENQIANCKRNDLRRLLKTYMVFLREACASQAMFDESFYAENQAWSRLYWDFVRQPAPAHEVLAMSSALRSSDDAERKLEAQTGQLESSCLSRKIDRELAFWTAETDFRDWWPIRRC